MTEQEKLDLDTTKAQVAETTENTFRHMLRAKDYTEEQMHDSGYGKYTKGDMIIAILTDGQKKTDRIWRLYFKKYPD